MGLSGAGFGAAQGLEQVLAQQMIRAQLAQRQKEAAQQAELAQAKANQDAIEGNARIEQGQKQLAQGQQQIDMQAGDRRERTNRQGVRRMIGDSLMQRTGPLGPEDRRSIAAMQVESGDLPDMSLLTEPKAARDPIADHREIAKIDAQYRQKPTGPQPDYEWVMRGNNPVQIRKGTAQPGDRPYEKAGDSTKASNSQDYEKEHDASIVRKINDLIGDPADPNAKNRVTALTAGTIGSLLEHLPIATDAKNVGAELQSLAADIAFSQLQKMRNASKTGGALGQVSDYEGKLLTNVAGSIRQDQTPANLIKQLKIVRDSAQRFETEAAKTGGVAMAPTSSHGGAPSRVDELLKKYGGG